MSADLDHIIIHATDPHRSAEFLARLLGTTVLPDWGPFVRVQTTNEVTLDYVHDDPPFTEQHCAFLVDDTTFDTAHRRLLDDCIAIMRTRSGGRPARSTTSTAAAACTSTIPTATSWSSSPPRTGTPPKTDLDGAHIRHPAALGTEADECSWSATSEKV